MRYLFTASLSLILLGCSSTNSLNSQNYSALNVANESEQLPIFTGLNRFPPRYPTKEVIAGTQGCATVEYVITKDKQISDVRVISSTSKNFAMEAKKVIAKWDWQSLTSHAFEKAVKVQTRFEYCLDDGNSNCAMANLIANTQCAGNDVVASVGYLVK